MKRSKFLSIALTFGFFFLYLPIIILVIYSFNQSRLVTVWGGFSTEWYGALFQNEQLLNAAFNSLKIASLSATIAAILGMLAGYALNRFSHFRFRFWLNSMIAAPLVMPEVITGLSLLLLFVGLQSWIGWPSERGFLTISIAHITFSMAYVAVIVQSRLVGFDKSLEEAASDLGSKPLITFFLITLPLMVPALISGWLLAFTLSLDDLVIASFVSGPGSTTLPMEVYSSAKLGVSPEINALGSLIILAVSVIFIVVNFCFMLHNRRHTQS